MHSNEQKPKTSAKLRKKYINLNEKAKELYGITTAKRSYSGTMHRGRSRCGGAECVGAWCQAVSWLWHMAQRTHHWAE